MREPVALSYTSQRLNLRYFQYGDPANLPLILVHGTRDHARSWDKTAAALVDRFCVYAPDLRGHGDSDRAIGGNYSIIDYALDIHALGEHIGREPYGIIGHSLGGGVALEYAGAFPEKVSRLITIEGLGGLGWSDRSPRPAHVRMRRWVESMRALELREPHLYQTIEEATERMIAANEHLTPELARHLTVEGTIKTPDGYAWKYDNFTRAGSPYEFNMEDARDLWNQIHCPILILWGEESWGRRNYDLDTSPFHNVEAIRIAGAGHWVQHDQFDVFISHVNRFLGA